MADHFGTDLDQLLPRCRQRPVLDLLGQDRLLLVATSGGSGGDERTTALPQIADLPRGPKRALLSRPISTMAAITLRSLSRQSKPGQSPIALPLDAPH
jgi:hypothetical protein